MQHVSKKMIGICIALAVIATLATNSIAYSPKIGVQKGNATSGLLKISNKKDYKNLELQPVSLKQRVAHLCQKYGLDYDQLYSVLQCESQLIPQYGDSGMAFGVAQFHLATFNAYCEGNYYNTFDQLECMAQMFSSGQAENWSCFNNLYSEVIYSDKSKTLVE